MTRKLRLLVPSSVVPVEQGAGETVLARHLRGYPDVLVLGGAAAACEFPLTVVRRRTPLWCRVGGPGRKLARWAASAGFDPELDFAGAQDAAAAFHPDAVVTVAHGPMMFLARRIAGRLGVPLVAFFHDWWPDYQPTRFRTVAERRFRSFHRDTAAALFVSPEFKRLLGDRPADVVLPPLPEPRAPSARRITPSQPIRLHYHGNISGAYRQPIVGLLRAAGSDSRFRIRLTGYVGPASSEEQALLSELGGYRGFLSPADFAAVQQEADVLLVVMSFFAGDQRRMETSFPSKIPQYCQLGRPIVVWGPETCSAVRWARNTGAAIAVVDPSPQEVLNRIALTLGDKPELDRLLAAAAHEGATRFSPEAIRAEFDSRVEALVRERHQP